MSLPDKIVAYMRKRPGKNLTNRQIADAFVNEIYVDEYRDKRGGAIQLSAEINRYIGDMMSSGDYPQIRLVEGEKRKTYCWNSQFTSPVNEDDTPVRDKGMLDTRPASNQKHRRKNRQGEKELYERLQDFLMKKLKVKAFIIEAGTSSNAGRAGTNIHSHPDLVGVEGLITKKGYGLLTQQLYAEYENEIARLWSFEVKEKVSLRDVRRYYTQANTNSGWANIGYFCVGEIDNKNRDKIIEALTRLKQQMNIGVIEINKKKPLASEILIQATPKKTINWDECSHLENNRHFREFMEYAINVFKTGKVY